MWQVLAGSCALAYAVQNVLVRVLGRRGLPRVWILSGMFAAAVLPLALLHAVTAPHGYEASFSIRLAVSLLGNLVAFYGYVRALEASEVSLVSPLLSLSPLFMLLTSWMILSEVPDGQGVVGVLVIVGGTYLLTAGPSGSPTDPLRRLWRESGCRWALLVAFVWSVTANVDKLAVRASSPSAYAFWFHLVMSVLMVPFLSRSRNVTKAPGDSSPGGVGLLLGLAGVGVLQALLAGTQMYAILRTDVTYVIAVKRSGMVVSVLMGGLLLGEQSPGRRFVASLIILAGLLGVMLR